MATLRQAIIDGRNALVNYTPLTDLISADKITFGNSPQKETMPRIVLEVSGVEYTPTFNEARKAQVFQMDFGVYSKTVDQCTAIMDEVRYALEAYTSADFSIRLVDETFQADVDNNLFGVIFAEFTDSVGDTNTNVAGTGKTLGELAAQDAANTTDLTVNQLVDFYVQETTGEVPAFNATGQLGEGTDSLWALRVIAEDYTGPLVQVANYDTLSGYTFSEVVDVYEADLGDYYIESGFAHYEANLQDGKTWVVTRIYDQIGNNDLVWDIAEIEAESGVVPIAARLAFDAGAYHVAHAENPYGFVSENQVRYDNFTCVVEAISTSQGPSSSARKVSFGGAKHPDGQDYDYFALQSYNNYGDAGMYRIMCGNGNTFTDVSEASALVAPVFAGNLDVRRTLSISREGTNVTAHSGINSFFKDNALAPAAGATCYIGWANNNYHPAGGTGDGFYGAAYISEEYKNNADLTTYSEAFADAIGYRNHRKILTNS